MADSSADPGNSSESLDTSGEPRWPAALAVMAAAVLPFALPNELNLVAPWALAATVALTVAAAYAARRRGHQFANEWLSYAAVTILTLGLAFALATIVLTLPHHTEPAKELLQSASVLWVSNFLVFATWYWRLDGGGPNARDTRKAHLEGAFLFPQMSVIAPGSNGKSLAEATGWRPGFVDYLALSLYTCTAFSPTDVPVLSRWAKLMMMIQSVLSLGIVVLLAARAVNIF